MTITVAGIFADLRELQEQLDIDLDEISPSGAVSLEDDLGMDSLSMMDFLVFLEKKYGVSIPDEKLHDVATVGDVVHVVGEVMLAGARA